jgi:flagellar FliL protein
VSKKLIIIAAVGLLAVGGGGAAAWKLGFLGGGAPAAAAQAAPPKVAYVEVREMTLRLADTATEHYIKLDPVLAVRAKDAEAMEDKIPIVRDRIVAVVTARSSNELSSPVGQRKLKEDLVSTLHKDFQDNLIDIYFSDYLVE